MALAKSDLGIARDYSLLVQNKDAANEIINDIEEEFKSTVSTLLKIVDSEQLLSENTKLSLSLSRRQPYLGSTKLYTSNVTKSSSRYAR